MTLMMSIDCPMKKIVSLMGIIALCAASFTACNKVSENDIQEKGKHFVKFTPVLGETRTILEENGNTISVKWAASDVDKFHVWENDAKGLTEATLNSDNTIATITGVFENASAGSYVYTSCFAADVDANGNPVVPAIQDALAGSFDPNADILIGEDITETTPQEELLVNFTRPVALTKMTLKGLEVGESVVSVSITAKNGKLTGAYDRTQGFFDLTSGVATIEVCPTGVTVGSDGTAPVYFVSAPVENEILEVEVWTSIGGGEPTAGRHYKKEFAKGISFPANKLTRFTANVTCCEESFEDIVEVFKETFGNCDSVGGNDGNFGNASSSEIEYPDQCFDNSGWWLTKGYEADHCAKFGASKAAGGAITPKLGITNSTSATITFKAHAWNSEEGTIILTTESEGVTISAISPSNVLATGNSWGTYTATIVGADENTTISFSSSKNRFFLDEIVVTEVRNSDPNVVSLEIAENTDITCSETEATVAIQSNKAWTVTSNDPLLVNTPIKISGTAQTSSFTVAFAAPNTSFEDKVATIHVVAGAGSYAKEKDIMVTQKGVVPVISIPDSEKTQTVQASATSATFHVSDCNFNWDVISVTVDGEANSSYTASKGVDGLVTVNFPSNAADGATTLDKTIVVTVGDTDLLTNACTITQLGETYVNPDAKTVSLTNANIVAAGVGKDGYASWSLTDEDDNQWSAFAIKNKHSNATSEYHYLQIKKYASNTAYYIHIPEIGSKILKIEMTVSGNSKPMTGGGNTATLFFSSVNSTAATGNGVVSGTGTSSVTIDATTLNLNSGYITADGAVRIWDVKVTYSE